MDVLNIFDNFSREFKMEVERKRYLLHHVRAKHRRQYRSFFLIIKNQQI